MIRKNLWIYPISIFILTAIAYAFSSGESDSSIKSRVVKLEGNGAICSGEQVKAPSGVSYIMSAGHCIHLAVNGEIMVDNEDGKKLSRKVLAEDANSDLILIEGLPGVTGLNVADHFFKFEKLRTFTHGNGLPTYETDGVVITTSRVTVPVEMISSAEKEQYCQSMPKYSIISNGFEKICLLSVDEDLTTALIIPGSSGGVAVNMSGELIGVASATDGTFGYLVPLKDIKHFLANY